MWVCWQKKENPMKQETLKPKEFLNTHREHKKTIFYKPLQNREVMICLICEDCSLVYFLDKFVS